MEWHVASVSLLIGEKKRNLVEYSCGDQGARNLRQVSHHLWQEIDIMTWQVKRKQL